MELNFKMTALIRNLERVLHGVARNAVESCEHFLFGLVVEIPGIEAEALGIVHLGLRLDAEQNVVGFHVVGIEIMAVVGGHERKLRGVGKLENALVHEGLFGQAVGLNLKIEAVGKERGIFFGYGYGVVEGAAAGDELVCPSRVRGSSPATQAERATRPSVQPWSIFLSMRGL